MGIPMMEMFFHFRQNEFLLFHGWMTQTFPAYFFSLFAVFALSLFYEAIRVGRACLYRVEENEQQECYAQVAASGVDAPSSYQQPPPPPSNPPNNVQCQCAAPPPLFYRAPVQMVISPSCLLSGWHFLQSILHFLQFILGFLLMLLAMTYNVPIFLALLLGHIAGYFLAAPLYQHGLAEEGRIGGECCCS